MAAIAAARHCRQRQACSINLFGGNLTEGRRDSLEVFDYLNRFRIGYETSNRVDNILIFGEADEILQPYFKALLRADSFYAQMKATTPLSALTSRVMIPRD